MNNGILQKWALFAEIIGGIAVVLSLIFVGLQVRQGAVETNLNTQAIQTSAYQELIGQISEVNVLLIENPELSEVRRKVLSGQIPDDPYETELFSAFARLIIRHADLAYLQYSNGLIDENRLISMLGPLRFEVLSNELGIAAWSGITTLDQGFSDYVRSLPNPN